jgi:hypothetical protein
MKKTYQIPSVEMALLMPSAIILAGSPAGLPKTDEPIPGGEGGD